MFDFLGDMFMYFVLGGGRKKEDQVEKEFPEIFNDHQNYNDNSQVSNKEKTMMILKIVFTIFILVILYVVTK